MTTLTTFSTYLYDRASTNKLFQLKQLDFQYLYCALRTRNKTNFIYIQTFLTKRLTWNVKKLISLRQEAKRNKRVLLHNSSLKLKFTLLPHFSFLSYLILYALPSIEKRNDINWREERVPMRTLGPKQGGLWNPTSIREENKTFFIRV